MKERETAKFCFYASIGAMFWGLSLYGMAGWIARTPIGFSGVAIMLLVSGFFVLCPKVK